VHFREPFVSVLGALRVTDSGRIAILVIVCCVGDVVKDYLRVEDLWDDVV
jgi:hypothetical protein